MIRIRKNQWPGPWLWLQSAQYERGDVRVGGDASVLRPGAVSTPAENRTLGTRGDKPQGVCLSFGFEDLCRGEEAEAESPGLRERHSSV